MPGDVYVKFGADTSELEAKTAVAKLEVRDYGAEVRKAAAAVKEAGASMDSELGRSLIVASGHLSRAKKETVELSHRLKELGQQGQGEHLGFVEHLTESLRGGLEPINQTRDHLKELFEVVAAGFAVEKIADWASETTEAMENVERESAKLGVSMEKVQELQGLSKLTGTSYDELSTQLERMQLQLARVGEKASPAGAALRALGIDATAFRGLGMDQQLNRIAEAASHFADGGAKAAAMQALLGRAGADLIPFLDRGKQGLDELRQTLHRTGFVMSSELVESMAQTREHISELSLAWQGASRQIYAAFNPAIDAAVRALSGFLEALTVDKIRAFVVAGIEGFARFSGAVADAFEGVRVALADAEAYFSRLWSVISTGASYAARAIGFVRDSVNALASATQSVVAIEAAGAGAPSAQPESPYGALSQPDFGGDMLDQHRRFAFQGALDGQRLKSQMDSYLKSVEDLFQGAKKDVQSAKGGEGEKAAKPQVPQLDLGGASGGGSGDAAALARETYQGEVQAARQAAQDIQQSLDGLLQRHQIGEDQWLAKSTETLAKEAAAVKAAYAKEIASADFTTQEKLAAAREEQRTLHDIARQLARDQERAAQETQRAWQSSFQLINGAVDAQIDPLLRGTENWGNAFRKVLATMVEDLIRFFVNWGLQATERFVQDQAMDAARVATHVGGNATIAASDAATAASGALAWVAGAVKAIEADAAQVFGGIFAFLAPLLGPGAAGPAAAGAAAVSAGMGAVASADIGMWQVPQDMLTMIHHNELVMPAAQAGAFRDMLSGGGGAAGGGVNISPTTHINVSALDGASVSQWMRSNSHAMLAAVDEAVRHGAHLGMRGLARG